ncbi:MAG: phage/plasmid replication protein, II/X family [Collimonas sp.]|uniref:phage/plasmid replication protein, II/X family n=1 Tax=Collimonas sp. TaxID=1963772 RepID=UPI0032633242
MIDLLDIQIDIPHKPFGADRVILREHSNIANAKRLSKKVALFADAPDLLVTSLDNGQKISIRCSPLKAMQGHNIFGTSNLRELGYHLICYVLETMEIQASNGKFKRWERGHYAIHELHITYRLGVGSHLFVLRVLKHLLRKLNVKLRPAWMKKGIGIEFNSPNTGVSAAVVN